MKKFVIYFVYRSPNEYHHYTESTIVEAENKDDAVVKFFEFFSFVNGHMLDIKLIEEKI
jgi:hypothetical protein